MALVFFGLAACDRSAPTTNDGSRADSPTPPASSSTPPASSPARTSATPASGDDELERLNAVTPADACALLTPEKIAKAYPGLTFALHDQQTPRMSGYIWDSRCTYWAGVGSIDFAKDTPTHTVEIFAATAVSEAKAQANLAARHESARSGAAYQAQPGLGVDAYAAGSTGRVSLFFVKGHSEVQIGVSDLDTPFDEKVKRAVTLAQSL